MASAVPVRLRPWVLLRKAEGIPSAFFAGCRFAKHGRLYFINLQPFHFWKIRCFQNVEMAVVGNNIVSISRDIDKYAYSLVGEMVKVCVFDRN